MAHRLLLLAVGDGRADWAGGLALLSALPARFGVMPAARDCALVLRALANAGRGAEAYALVREMQRNDAGGAAPDVQCLNHALRACGRMRMAKEARELMGLVDAAAVARKKGKDGGGAVSSRNEEEERYEAGRSAYTYSLAIDAAAKAGDADRAVALLGEMRVSARGGESRLGIWCIGHVLIGVFVCAWGGRGSRSGIWCIGHVLIVCCLCVCVSTRIAGTGLATAGGVLRLGHERTGQGGAARRGVGAARVSQCPFPCVDPITKAPPLLLLLE